jgi:hypothetical protein
MYKILAENLSEDELADYQQNMLVELAEARPEVEQQEFKMTKSALKQVQDLVSFNTLSAATFSDILIS